MRIIYDFVGHTMVVEVALLLGIKRNHRAADDKLTQAQNGIADKDDLLAGGGSGESGLENHTHFVYYLRED